MAGAPTPPVLPEAFAADADPAYINTIPATSADPQRASFQLGFPPTTMTPIIAGGKPMLGPDMNGVLNALSAHLFAQQAGQFYPFNASVASAIGGYKLGAILAMADNSGLWQNLVDGNSANPEAGGAGWVAIFRYGYVGITSTGGVYNLSVGESSFGVIVVSGALVANLQVNFPPLLRSWLVVNTTSGAFTVTVKTAGGAGVDVPQGGYGAPVEVYGDGTNLYPTVAPLTIPTSVAPDPNTYVLRNNLGDVYARIFNSAVTPASSAVVNVITDTGDGNFRRQPVASFEAQLLLQMIGGAVTAGQVPLAAVVQYAANILANAVLTGVPTAPTAAAGTNSTQVATTAFAAGSLIVAGTSFSLTLPGGFIIKGGFAQGAAGLGDIAIAFAGLGLGAFPTACRAALCCTANRTGAGSSGTGYTRSVLTTGFTMLVDEQQTGAGTGLRGGYWLAVGN